MSVKKVFTLAPSEDWIVDRFVQEWNRDNADITVASPNDADVIWLMADWCWSRIPIWMLMRKKVITTVHHIVPEKFGLNEHVDFTRRDQVTTAYHVPNRFTEEFIRPLTQKPIHVIPYWANQKIWHPTADKATLRKKHGLPEDGFLVGSFQRDTEGSDLVSPKKEKGPDLLADALERLAAVEPRLHVVLAGWRRQYIINRLNAAGIRHTYLEKPDQPIINELYQTLDMYMVSARQEGGPQALIECGLLGVHCISRRIGISEIVLPEKAINDDLWLARPAIPDVERFKLPAGYAPFRKLIEEV